MHLEGDENYWFKEIKFVLFGKKIGNEIWSGIYEENYVPNQYGLCGHIFLISSLYMAHPSVQNMHTHLKQNKFSFGLV